MILQWRLADTRCSLAQCLTVMPMSSTTARAMYMHWPWYGSSAQRSWALTEQKLTWAMHGAGLCQTRKALAVSIAKDLRLVGLGFPPLPRHAGPVALVPLPPTWSCLQRSKIKTSATLAQREQNAKSEQVNGYNPVGRARQGKSITCSCAPHSHTNHSIRTCPGCEHWRKGRSVGGWLRGNQPPECLPPRMALVSGRGMSRRGSLHKS
jgi:hypothetical protein